MTHDHDHQHGHDHDHDHDKHHHHGHGHANDQGWQAMLRYLRNAPRMWSSTVNNAVVKALAPRKAEVLVDIGAGIGAGTMVAAKAGASVIAVEPTPYMRNTLSARRWLQRARKRITVIDGAAERMEVDDASVHAVWSVNTMHHWNSVEAGAAEIRRVLRPGGRVLLVDEDFEDPSHPDHERFANRHGDDDGHHHGFSMVDAEQMGDVFHSAGLVDVEASKQQMAGRPVIAVTAKAPV